MKILLVNDDGFASRGIVVLEEALREKGHDVWVVAPDGQRSAKSHAISLNGEPVTIEKVSEKHFKCSGLPADCVLYGGSVIGRKPDLVVSGINKGYNRSTDIIYSGTCGAASEGDVRGIKSIALSAQYSERPEEIPYEKAARFLAENLDKFYPLIAPGTFLNINVPIKGNGKDWGVGRVGRLEYFSDITEVEEAADGDKKNFVIVGDESMNKQSCDTPETDTVLVDSGMISVSPIRVLPAVDEESARVFRALSKG